MTWDARIARARELASSRPAARELLTFYAALAEYQKSRAASAGDAATFDVERVVEAIPGFIAWLGQNGQSDLAGSIDIDRVASALRASNTDGAASGVSRPSTELGTAAAGGELPPEGGGDESESRKLDSESPAERFVVESLRQAFAEQLVNRNPSPPTREIDAVMRCPRCAALPVAAVLREAGHGAKRFLLCALCLHEWECLRIVCPACGEEDFDRLPVYTAEQFAHVRISACDSCHHYIKTIDLTTDGLAVPCVDDIASVSLDIWARERGYTRVKSNVLGV
jgi:formate dehydrogenase maturation protein FdhE